MTAPDHTCSETLDEAGQVECGKPAPHKHPVVGGWGVYLCDEHEAKRIRGKAGVVDAPRSPADLIAEARRLCSLATPGPWFAHNVDDESCMNVYYVGTSPQDADFEPGEVPDVIAVLLLQEGGYRIGRGNRRWQENAAPIAEAPSLLPAMAEGWTESLEALAKVTAERDEARANYALLFDILERAVEHLPTAAPELPEALPEALRVAREACSDGITWGADYLAAQHMNLCASVELPLLEERDALRAEVARLRAEVERLPTVPPPGGCHDTACGCRADYEPDDGRAPARILRGAGNPVADVLRAAGSDEHQPRQR